MMRTTNGHWWLAVVMTMGCGGDVLLGSGDGSAALHGSPGSGGITAGAGGSAAGMGGTAAAIPTYTPDTIGCAHRDPGFVAAEIWEGYVEGDQFPSGSDRIELLLEEAEPSLVVGRIRFGAAPGRYARLEDGRGGTSADPFIEGFDYTIVEGRREGTRLIASIAPDEVWCEFCEQQASYPNQSDRGTTEYLCSPPDDPTVSEPSSDPLEVACAGQRVCSCDESECWALGFGDGRPLAVRRSLDVVVEGNQATGTLRPGPFIEARNVHLTLTE